MIEFIALMSVAAVAALAFLVFRKKGEDSSSDSGGSYSSDMIVDASQKRLHMAMKRYLVDETNAMGDWHAFELLQGLKEGSKMPRPELIRRLAAGLKIDEAEADARLNRVLAAVQKVKKGGPS